MAASRFELLSFQVQEIENNFEIKFKDNSESPPCRCTERSDKDGAPE
jgi:hypothetical protein